MKKLKYLALVLVASLFAACSGAPDAPEATGETSEALCVLNPSVNYWVTSAVRRSDPTGNHASCGAWGSKSIDPDHFLFNPASSSVYTLSQNLRNPFVARPTAVCYWDQTLACLPQQASHIFQCQDFIDAQYPTFSLRTNLTKSGTGLVGSISKQVWNYTTNTETCQSTYDVTLAP